MCRSCNVSGVTHGADPVDKWKARMVHTLKKSSGRKGDGSHSTPLSCRRCCSSPKLTLSLFTLRLYVGRLQVHQHSVCSAVL